MQEMYVFLGGADMADSQIALVYPRDWASCREQLCCRSRNPPQSKKPHLFEQ